MISAGDLNEQMDNVIEIATEMKDDGYIIFAI